MKRVILATAILGLFALALAACGGGSQSVDVTVKMSEFLFDPDGIEVPAGAQVNLTLDNSTGTLEHNFLVMNQGVQVSDTFTDADQGNVYFEQLATPAGDTAQATFTAPAEPGVYQFLCSVAGHLTQGMEGTLTVVAP